MADSNLHSRVSQQGIWEKQVQAEEKNTFKGPKARKSPGMSKQEVWLSADWGEEERQGAQGLLMDFHSLGDGTSR